jgi:transposase-like protein
MGLSYPVGMEFSLPKLMDRIPDEASAYQFLEELRWDGRPVCPHCGSVAKHYFLTPKTGERATRTGSLTQRRVWKCKDCRKQFTVLVGTIFHGTKIPVRTWIFVVFEMCASKNGVSAREIERKYDLTAKSAWFMTHRIREAMRREPLAGLLTGTIVADETWVGGKTKNRHKDVGYIEDAQTPVVALVHKETGEVRSQVARDVTGDTLRGFIEANATAEGSELHTDEWAPYRKVGQTFDAHRTVNHKSREYVRDGAGTNQIEGYFSQLKRSIDGTHHAVSAEHLDRYLAEFDYRYSTRKMSDSQRMVRLIEQTGGRRLTYRPLTDRT